MSRACTKCGVVKPLAGFRKDARYHDGYTRQCIDCRGEWRREHYHAEPTRERTLGAGWKRSNKARVYARARLHRYQALVVYGGDPPHCACCGESGLAFLALDHINGGGRRHRKQTGGGGFYSWLRQNNYPEGLQVLCHNCNMGKRSYGGVCPHQATAFVPAWS